MARIIKETKGVDGRWPTGFIISGEKSAPRSYSVWTHMKNRCKENHPEQTEHTTYIGCSVGEGFLDYQDFAEWYNSQKGCDQLDMEVDKDLLIEGNKVYSPQTCLLIPKQLNMFLTVNRKRTLPIGVYFCKVSNKFKAQIRISGKKIGLGSYRTSQEASFVYYKAKIAEAEKWLVRLKSGEFEVSHLVTEALQNWVLIKESEVRY